MANHPTHRLPAATLKHLGVIKNSEKKGYECGDIAKFIAEVESLNVPEMPAKKSYLLLGNRIVFAQITLVLWPELFPAIKLNHLKKKGLNEINRKLID